MNANYTYRYPEKQLNLTKLAVTALGGTAKGTVSLVPVPGKPRITLDLNYSDVDTVQLAQVYPWDRKYMIYSKAQGRLQGWLERDLTQYEFEGDSLLTSYTPEPTPGVIAFPAAGPVTFAIKPGEMQLKSADLHIFETTVQAAGKIVGTEADLTVNLASSNLEDLKFLYPDANGKGSFKGTLKGPTEKPTLEGNVVLDGYKYRDLTIQHAEGSARLDTRTETADLIDLKVAVARLPSHH